MIFKNLCLVKTDAKGTYSLKEPDSSFYEKTVRERNPYVSIYIQEYSDEIFIGDRPLVIICPGGAYEWTSDREAEPVAIKYMNSGCNVAVLRYSTKPAVFPEALLQLGFIVRTFREKAKEYHIDPDRIIVSGFSAGGHLAASYGCFWKKYADKSADTELYRPNGLLLCYPVITSGKFAHDYSIKCLLGDDYGDKDKMELVSLEKQVNTDVPRTFIWSTVTDESVPVENTLLFAQALKEKGINFELHIFPEGGHGLSLANELTLGEGRKECFPKVAAWADLAVAWIGKAREKE